MSSTSQVPIPPLILSDSKHSALLANKPKVTKSTATQATSVTTAVVLNAAAGVVTMVASTLAAEGSEEFTLTNSYIAADSVVLANLTNYAGTQGLPTVHVETVDEGSCVVVVQNCDSSNALDGIVTVGFLVV